MLKLISFSAVLLLLISCNSRQKIKYPTTEKIVVTDAYFDTEVKDPYRWLEDDMSAEVKDWVKLQNEVTFSYLEEIPQREELKNRLEKLWNYEKIGTPFQEGDYTYFYKNDGLQNQYVLYRKKGEGAEQVFIDPNQFTEDGTISLAGIYFSEDGSLLAYSISEGGSDWRKVIVIETENKTLVEDTLLNIKFSGISWNGNEGYYYSSYDKPEKSVLSDKTDHHKLYYHKLGTPQNEDEIIFGAEDKFRYVRGGVTKDLSYLIISASKATSGNNLFIKDLRNKNSKLIQLTADFKSDSYIIHNIGTTFYAVTNLEAPNKRLVQFNLSNTNSENWKDLIPETENVLSLSKGGGYFFAKYFQDANSKVIQYNYDGDLMREVEFSGKGNVSGFGGKEDQKEIFYNFSNYITPRSSFKYNVETGKSVLYWSPNIDFNTNDFVAEQHFYTSKDGTKVPISIMYKKGVELNGKNPTILYGYGGFNVSLKPSFSVTNAVWLEQGGVYAVANLRGGGEYGKKWHDAGIKMQKQNVFDDFIAAAEFLIENKYTNSNHLAIKGSSNGGLLVGACMLQRPDLFKVALPGVGVLDMLHYHTFTSGAGWAYDYGTAEESKEMFEYLKSYSPVHNVKEGVEYPATLVITGDHDDRVVPAHSFKFAAELQAKQSGNNPTLIRIETNAGHGAGTPVSKRIEEAVDIMGFVLYNCES
ncbi:MAG: S9 family peptidase [Flavobacteriales bacterium]|nr:S9 family peptidase [Flavobacteriales bacterium]